MKNDMQIFVIGGGTAVGIYASLVKRFKSVKFFRNELELKKSINRDPDILIFEDSDTLHQVNVETLSSTTQVLYLSNDDHYNYILSLLKVFKTRS